VLLSHNLSTCKKGIFHRYFCAVENFRWRALPLRECAQSLCVLCGNLRARIRVAAMADTRAYADLLDFSLLCSNPIAVLAIRAGTVSIPAI
jgi:hypothetical protein